MLKLPPFPVKDNDPNQFRYVEEPLSEYLTSIRQEQRRLQEIKHDEEAGVEKAAILTFIGLAYEKLGSYSLSLEYFEQLLAVGHDLADRKIIGRACTNLGCVHRKLGNLQKAFEYFEKSLALARDRDDQKAIAKNLNNLGNVFELRCEVPDAIECHVERLEIARRVNDLDGICKACCCLGSLYHVCGELQKSIERYEELLDTLRIKLKIQIVLADDDSESDDEVDVDEIAYDIYREEMEKLNKPQEVVAKPSLPARVRQKCSDIGYLAKSLVKK